jgi:hypothetical protein
MRRRRLVGLAACLAVAVGSGAAAALPAGGNAVRVVDPRDFVRVIDNEYLPLRPGTAFVYTGTAEGEHERNVVSVTRRTKEILGVTCVVVLDTVTVDGRPAERTFDWYAQDRRGNVWYFGEDSRDFEDGRWVRSDGSWEAGVDGAEPGIVMKAHPRPGDTYRQEHYAGHAEDRARVVGTIASLSVPYATFERVLVTKEWTPLEPGVVEKKYYARGVGFVKSVMVEGGSEHVELVAVRRR